MSSLRIIEKTMNRKERKQFIIKHIRYLQERVLSNLDKMPERWDGLELKAYIGEQFSIPKGWLEGKRLREYNNDVLVNNL